MIDKKIKQKFECSGCYACANICPVECILMDEDAEGFRYPKVDYDKCLKCSNCINICPKINREILHNEPLAYACINNDESIRLQSSSGGVFTLLSKQMIDNGGVVFGAAFDKNFKLRHCYVDSVNGLEKLRGSKYLQSQIGSTYKNIKDFLNSGINVIFSGTPCQIGGLKSYLGKPYDNLLSVDIICHGVVSPDVWEKYMRFREKIAGSTTQKISFRCKKKGWKRFSVSFLFNNNTEYIETLDKDLYMKAFLNNVCLRPSCYDCKFKGLNRQSDITLADFWGIQNVFPELDDDKGTSLIFVNSESGKKFFDEIKNNLSYQEVDVNLAVKNNSAAIKSIKYNPKRNDFMKEKDRLTFDKLVNRYCKEPLSIRVKMKIKSELKKLLVKTRLIDTVKLLFKKTM